MYVRLIPTKNTNPTYMDFRIPTFLVLVFIVIKCSSTFPIAKPGCPDRCGNVSIPYPFGMSGGCFMNVDFFIECDNVTNKPSIPDTGLEIRSISIEGQLRFSFSVAYDCYDPTTNVRSDYFSPLTHLSPTMTLNSTANKFTALGCDTYALIRSDGQYRGYTTGCMSTCDFKEDVAILGNGSCSGFGCCQTSIARGTWMMNTTLDSFNNHSLVSAFNPCSYAFVVEESAFRFSVDILSSVNKNSSFPAVADWVAEFNVTCREAQQANETYACKTVNSECYDQVGASGYRCKCKDGFEGNPYLPVKGCHDIDECASSTHNCGNNSMCVNTLGSYRCICNPGHRLQTISGRNGTDTFCEPPSKENYWPIAAGVGSVIGVLVLVAAIFTYFRVIKKWQKKKRKEKFFKRNGGLLLQGQLSSNEKLIHKTKIFSAKELSKASDGFNPNRVLGEGGQGTVYKGMLTDGTIVAIKKSKSVDEDQLQQFINEVIILSQVIHKNVVKLLGCCLETEVPLLVYEFVSNGTLYSLIHNTDADAGVHEPLTWSTRLRIAREVASALAYLHSSISTPIFHKDIKSLNILMDEKFTAKIADFGTSRSVEIDKTHLTTRVQGTFGYIDPEFFQSNQFTDKSDVYSFGVVLIELLTGKKLNPVKKGENASELGLVGRFLKCMEQGCLIYVLDPEIIEETTQEEVFVVAGLAARCVHFNGRRRPSMKELAMELENIKKSKSGPTEVQQQYSPSFSYVEHDYGDMSTFTSESTQSNTFPLLHDTF